MKIKSTLILLFSLTILACSKEESNEVNFRLSNVSEVKFENATYNDTNFGDIEPGGITEYRYFENQYSYGSVEITINGEKYGWQPIDYVGESLLEDGNYTFEYSFDVNQGVLMDKLIRD